MSWLLRCQEGGAAVVELACSVKRACRGAGAAGVLLSCERLAGKQLCGPASRHALRLSLRLLQA